MGRPSAYVRPLLTATLLFGGACSGSLNCSGCFGTVLQPIPGGFDPTAQIERAAQVRVTQSGLDLIGTEFQDLMSAYAAMSCGQPTDLPCPTNFVTPTGATNPSSCQGGVCVEQVSGDPGPLIGFEIDRTVSGNATVCRDDPTLPGARRCFAWLRFEAMQLTPVSPDQVVANVTVQIETNQIPFRYEALGGMDCVLDLSSVPNTQDVQITATLDRYSGPAGPGGQLKVDIADVAAMIPDQYLNVSSDPDPRFNDGRLLCAIADIGFVKQILIGQLTNQLATIISDEVDKALGTQCLVDADCPAQSNCNTDDLCEEDVSGDVVPAPMGLEGRLDLSQLLAGFLSGRPGRGDISFMVGGDSSADTGGINIGALGGAEVVDADPSCATLLDSPRLRPGFTAPLDLPTSPMADLNWDGTDETPYMAAAGLSQALMDQFMWTIYTTGLFCTSLTSNDIDLLNTGSLGLLISSLDRLTHRDKFPDNIFAARLSIYPGSEPRLRIGSGETTPGQMMPTLVEPLLSIEMDDFEVNFFAQIEERWVRLMTVVLDLKIGLGATVTPNNEIQFLIGDLSNAVSNVRVSNSELLAESAADLESSIPSLISLALPGFTGALPPFALPTAADLGGFELDVLGLRGVEENGRFENIAVYADLGFDGTQVGNLSLAAETSAKIELVAVPDPAAFAVTNKNGPTIPSVMLALGGSSVDGGALEYQFRIDGGLWSVFFASESLELRRPEFLAQGRHTIDVRARVQGDYRSLDATPVRLEVMIDPEPPRLTAKLAASAKGVLVNAWDVVSADRLTIEVGADEVWREVQLDADGFVDVPEIDSDAAIAIRATDEQGNAATRVVRAPGTVEVPTPEVVREVTGCSVASPAGHLWILLVLLPLVIRRRR